MGLLKSDFDPGSLVQEMDTIKIPVVDKKSPTGLSVETYPILHPHRVLSYLFDVVKIEIDTAKLHNFWDHAISVGEPWAVSSPATREHIPLGVHGDSARLWTVYQVEKQMSISLNLPLFRPRSTRFSRFVLITCPSNKLYKNRTLNAVWKRLVWSINACFDGLNPTVGVGRVALTGPDALRAGTPMTAKGLKFCLTEIRGDWEFHRDCWRPTAAWNATNICIHCPARASGPDPYLYYNTPEDNSSWDKEEFGLDEFVAKRLKDTHLCA